MPMSLTMALMLLGYQPVPANPPPRVAISADDIVSALETTLADAIARAEPSVVAIHRDKSEHEETLAIRGRLVPQIDRRQMFQNFDVIQPEALSFDYGSGVVIGDKGQILTAYHVVKGANHLAVRAVGYPTGFEAEILAADPRSDLAVIAPREVPGKPFPNLKPMPIGDATKLRKGSFLLALGNPFNAAQDGRASASWGILSNVARRLEQSVEDQVRSDSQLRHFPTLLQLDSKLNLGMSGGAVVNLKGELVGITTAAANASGFDALAGYAIPMDLLGRNVVRALKEGREYEYGFLGIRLAQDRSNRVDTATEGSPAVLGGVLVDDQITAVGDMPVTDSESLVLAINSIPAGEPVVLKIIRHNVPMEKTVELAKRRVSGQVIATNRPEPWRGVRVDYTSTLANTTFAQEMSSALARKGVVVTDVETGSDADKAGLKVGQVISRVGDTPVPNPREFYKAAEGAKGSVKIETEQGPLTIK